MLRGGGQRARLVLGLAVGVLLSASFAGFQSFPASAGSSSFKTIAAGGKFGLALRTDGTVLAWGDNQFGELGNGATSAPVVTPTVIPGLSNVVAVAAGALTAMALKNDGTVLAWGYNQDGEVGIGTFTPSVPTPTQVPGLSAVTAISVGGGDLGALKADGTVWEWGDNTLGQLGTGSTARNNCCVASPQQAVGVSGVTAFALGSDHTVAVRSDGSVLTWGRNADGELGNGIASTSGCFCIPTPAPVPGLSGAIGAAAALNSSLVVKGDGTAWTFGRGFEGGLGTGSSASTPTPTQVPGLSNVIGASGYLGGFTYLAVLSSGAVVGWGFSGFGELLNNTQTPSITPTPVPASGLPASTTVAVAVGFQWSMALEGDGTVWSAGSNRYGQLGLGFATTYDPSTCTCVPTAARSMVTTGGLAAAITLMHANPDPGGDPYYVDTFVPGQVQQFNVVISGSLSSAYLYIDGVQQQSVLSGGTQTWTPPGGSFTSHTFLVRGTDQAGNPVSSQPIALYALVQVEGDAVSILPDGAVPYNAFEFDPLLASCLDHLPNTAACADQPPAAPAVFRMLNGGTLRGKSNGTSFIQAPQFIRRAVPGVSFYCDGPGSTAAVNPASGQLGPFSDGNLTSYVSTLETRVNLTVPNIFEVPTPPGTTGPTNQSPFIPWIFSSIYIGIAPTGSTLVQWADASPDHTGLGNSLFPYHYLYQNRTLVSPRPHPTPDLIAWTRTAAQNISQVLDFVYSDLGFPLGQLYQRLLESSAVPPEIFASDVLFTGMRAECARQRFAAYYQNQAPNLEDYLQQHFPKDSLPLWWFGRIYNGNLWPHWNPHEWSEGITKPGFVRDFACVVPGCPGLEHMKVFGVFSPVSVDVYDAAGHHTGPLPDGTIEQGIPSVTYITIGHGTFLILPNDPAYRVQLTGSGSGLATVDATDFNGQAKLEFEQYDNIPVTANSRGTVTMGQTGTPISWDVNGTGNSSALTPTTLTTNPAPDSTDITPPATSASVVGTMGQAGYYRSAVDASFVGHDDLSGVARTDYSLDGGTAWTVYAAPLHFGSDGRYQVLYRSTDYAGNQEPAQAVSFVVDTVPPAVSISVPTPGPYTVGQTVSASFACSDGGSGIGTCAGTVGNGVAIDTTSAGQKNFTVTATDLAGNQTVSSVTYSVDYAICALYDQTRSHLSGSTVPIKLAICDAGGNDVSNAGTVVTATGLTEVSTSAPGALAASGNANPDNNFRFDATLGTAGGYVYNLSTSGLGTGTYAVGFTVAGDPIAHTVLLEVR